MILGAIWAAGAAGVYSFYRLTGIDEDEPRGDTALFSALWPVLVPVGIVWMGIDGLMHRHA